MEQIKGKITRYAGNLIIIASILVLGISFVYWLIAKVDYRIYDIADILIYAVKSYYPYILLIAVIIILSKILWNVFAEMRKQGNQRDWNKIIKLSFILILILLIPFIFKISYIIAYYNFPNYSMRVIRNMEIEINGIISNSDLEEIKKMFNGITYVEVVKSPNYNCQDDPDIPQDIIYTRRFNTDNRVVCEDGDVIVYTDSKVYLLRKNKDKWTVFGEYYRTGLP